MTFKEYFAWQEINQKYGIYSILCVFQIRIFSCIKVEHAFLNFDLAVLNFWNVVDCLYLCVFILMLDIYMQIATYI